MCLLFKDGCKATGHSRLVYAKGSGRFISMSESDWLDFNMLSLKRNSDDKWQSPSENDDRFRLCAQAVREGQKEFIQKVCSIHHQY